MLSADTALHLLYYRRNGDNTSRVARPSACYQTPPLESIRTTSMSSTRTAKTTQRRMAYQAVYPTTTAILSIRSVRSRRSFCHYLCASRSPAVPAEISSVGNGRSDPSLAVAVTSHMAFERADLSSAGPAILRRHRRDHVRHLVARGGCRFVLSAGGQSVSKSARTERGCADRLRCAHVRAGLRPND